MIMIDGKKTFPMCTRIVAVAAVAWAIAAALTVATPAHATFKPCSDEPAEHCTVSDEQQYTSSDDCGFPITVDDVFTNDITEHVDGQGVTTQQQLHQSEVITYAARA